MTVYFAIECTIKLVGLGPAIWSRDAFNVFDFLVVLFAVIELIVVAAGITTLGANFNMLRCIRLLRIFKMARNWSELRYCFNSIL